MTKELNLSEKRSIVTSTFTNVGSESTLNLSNEIWKDIPNYEGLYQISNHGRIKSLIRKFCKQEQIVKCSLRKDGYIMVYLSKNGKKKYHSVHRIVATVFIPNPNMLPFVNHINENKADNRVENLEWCDAKYNTNYGTCIERRAKSQTNKHGAISVIQYSLKGDMIAEYPSLMEASRMTKVPARAICACCKNYQKSAFGYVWKYKNDGA